MSTGTGSETTGSTTPRTADAARDRPGSTPPAAASGTGGPPALHRLLAGTGTLVRFALRRDRVRIPVWIAALLMANLSTLAQFEGLYGGAAERASIAKTMGSPAALAMTGPRHYLEGGYGLGAMLGHQVIGFYGVLTGLMAVLIVVRHTRDEEETGRAELLRSAVVGRHAALTAALTVAVTASLALGGLLAAGLAAAGAPGVNWGGSLLYGAVFAGLGIVFAGVAAVTVQITEHARGAAGMALGVIGLAYALRAAGDVGDGTLSWLSPIGWAQRSYPFVDDLWWPLLLTLAAAVALCGTGYALSVRRDVGEGLRTPPAGRRTASAVLVRPFGFALRLHRGMLAGFGAGVFLLGTMYGSMLGDVEEMLKDIDVMDQVLAQAGGSSLVESFASVVMIVNSVVAAVYVVLAALRPRAEEGAGRAEPLLATGLSRTRWVWSHLSVTLVGGTFTLLLAGLGFGVAGAASTGDRGLVLSLTGAALAYAPALWVTAGVAAVLFGWLPRATAAAWLVPVYAFLVGYLGRLLQFPDWMNDLSPFGHVPQLPAKEMDWTPMAVLTAVAAVLLAAGLAGFRRRDLETK
ncbi:ABC transporter permease [Streptomyces sp. WMMB 322]|uniref:ABC transporter permease n=1 Tax=Streptomyces sp. WMMB 322 TaxID=1286821 RepID=UPI000823A636|nr:ABC transporter permease [Streptomyces sp. WMMB 322]SCK38402.1 ABC-2 type transport system permease protein [Streptomyces sp. WMMB 322]